jgi:Flp pilus assembly protein TadD, contains TPR repeats
MWKLFLFICTLFACTAMAQYRPLVREYEKNYRTYGFSDPDPVAAEGKLYPYFRWDGFTDKPENRNWKVVELENEYLRIAIMPDIGGKIWSVFDKKNNRSLFYENHVVKFRDVAMRGPWTSGGIEANFGIIGHTPNCSTPVNYITRENADSSVSCIINTFDALARAFWTLEINLPRGAAYFTTRSFWHNSSPVEQPYYTWMNAALKASDDLELEYPGTHRIGHSGEAWSWPLDSGKIDMRHYANNNYIGSKSYHIVGAYSNYFGARWSKDDYGMAHYAPRQEKLGKKVFFWALSENGKIWEELLTDTDGQYVEMQSGRLFNQNQPQSSFTPFKQLGFPPFDSNNFTEYWYPYRDIGGLSAANSNGALHISRQDNVIYIRFSPVRTINDTLRLYNHSGKLIYQEPLSARPLEPVTKTITLSAGESADMLSLNGVTEEIAAENELQRPVSDLENFNWNSAYGLYLQGRDLLRFRLTQEAEEKIRASLLADPTYLPSLVQMAMIMYRKMQYDSSLYYAKQALGIDTYDGAANYYYGLAAARLGKLYDALDGFEIATLTTEFRCAAYAQMSRMYLQRNQPGKAAQLAAHCNNMEGLQLAFLAARLQGAPTDKLEACIAALDPLNHFIRFEKYWQARSAAALNAFMSPIRNEMPVEIYLELACWYAGVGRMEEARELLSLSPPNAETRYWQAWLHRNEPQGARWLAMADSSDVLQVFPFREESAEVMQWAMQHTASWKPRYFLALILSSRNQKTKACKLLTELGETAPFAPLYITRARLRPTADTLAIEKDLHMACRLDQRQWRYGQYLARFYLNHSHYQAAMQTASAYYRLDPANYLTGMLYARCLLRMGHYGKADEVLKTIRILPFEGRVDGRKLFEETKLMLALEALKKKNYNRALQLCTQARQWPRNMGVGKPYDNMIDNRLEDWMTALAYAGKGRQQEAIVYLEQVANATHDTASLNTLVQCLALHRLGRQSTAEALLNKWTSLQEETVAQWGTSFFRDNTHAAGIDKKAYTRLLQSITKKEDSQLF